ncbi:MAG: hypothetical protein ACREDL_07195, partial [Bradyrhizobium sp.]
MLRGNAIKLPESYISEAPKWIIAGLQHEWDRDPNGLIREKESEGAKIAELASRQQIARNGPASTNKEEQQMPTYNILLMGASYGSLLASKLLFGGHSI